MKTGRHNALLLACVTAFDQAAAQSVSGTATVSLSRPSGIPEHLASGMIYGIPAKPNQIPAEFYSGMGFRWNLAGAAQTATTGWLGGVDDFDTRFQDTFGEYQTTRQNGGEFQLRISDLWGDDGGQPASAPYPGDGGNWTSWATPFQYRPIPPYLLVHNVWLNKGVTADIQGFRFDLFLEAIVHNIFNHSMQDRLSVEISNEPDGTWFWNRPQSQFLDMWAYAVRKFRTLLSGSGVKLIGPSFAGQPGANDTWWPVFLDFINKNGTTPDVYTWHAESFDPTFAPGDPQVAAAALTQMLEANGMDVKPFCINEYAAPADQQPGGVAWFISRLERNNIPGLRGNWADGNALHDYLANLLAKPGAGTSSYNYTGEGYWPNGEWRVYQYYTASMVGERVATVGSADRSFDVYATSDGLRSGVKVLCGSRQALGTWQIKVEDLSSVGLPKCGTIGIRTLRFDFTGGIYGDVGLPVDMGVTKYRYSGDSVTWSVTPATNQTAYAFEFVA